MDEHKRPPVLDDLLRGEGLSLAAASALLPASPSGLPPTTSTLARWASEGVRRPDGRRVFLEAARVGSRLYTSRSALARFIAELNKEGDRPCRATAT
jgi:hypothetical protein